MNMNFMYSALVQWKTSRGELILEAFVWTKLVGVRSWYNCDSGGVMNEKDFLTLDQPQPNIIDFLII